MNADGCSAEPCPSEEELNKLRVTLFVMVCVGAFVMWLALSMRPVLPELDWLIARVLQGFAAVVSVVTCVSDTQGDAADDAEEILGVFSLILATGSWLVSKVEVLREK
jgi:hypothetical protein